MKNILTAAIALLVAGGLAASASAASLSPGDGTFAGTGVVTLKKGTLTVTCVLNLTGHITNGVGTVDTATFTGSSGLCSTISKLGVWTLTATASGAATISGFAISSGLLGVCGPGSVSTSVSNSGLISFASTLPPDCQISGAVQTSPAVVVVVP